MPHTSLIPATGQLLQTCASWDSISLEQALKKHHPAQQAWAQTTFPQRAEVLRNAAKQLHAQCDHYAALVTQEMGKPLREARAEVEKCVTVCDYYARRRRFHNAHYDAHN